MSTDQSTGNEDPSGSELDTGNGDGFDLDADPEVQEPAPGVDAPDGEGSDDDRKVVFFEGDPEDLPEELHGIYKTMERGLQAKFRDVATIRKEAEAARAEAVTQQEELTRLSVQLQARLDGHTDQGRQSDPAHDPSQETGPSREDLIAQITEKVNAGGGLRALIEGFDQLGVSSAYAKKVDPKVDERITQLEQRLSQYEGPAKDQQNVRALNDAFEQLKSDEYPQLGNAKVVARVKAAFDGNDPAIMDLLGKGMHITAMRFATERALREVTENRTITKARSRKATAPPTGESGRAEQVAFSATEMSTEDLVDKVLKGLM